MTKKERDQIKTICTRLEALWEAYTDIPFPVIKELEKLHKLTANPKAKI